MTDDDCLTIIAPQELFQHHLPASLTVLVSPMASAHGVIYVSNLPYEAHEELVQQAFEDEQFAVVSRLL